jgi:hypothetical protein
MHHRILRVKGFFNGFLAAETPHKMPFS